MVFVRELRKLFRRESAVYCVVPRVIPRDEEAQRVEGDTYVALNHLVSTLMIG